jgi:uncharacterized phage protein gp47/JayE
MPIERPTLPQLIDQGAAEFESRLPGVLARVRNSVVGVINRVLAGALSALYQYAQYLNDQAWPDRAAAEYLPEHGARWGKNRLPAANATGTVQFTGVDGASIDIGTVVQRSDNVQYITTAIGVISAGVANVSVQAVDAGQLGNAVIGTSLKLTTAVTYVNAVAAAQTALAGGADMEGIEAWRARILARIRKPPQGGADFDYEAWALAVPGVTRAWVYPQEQGPGTVVVRFVRDDDASIIPDAGEIAAVQAAIDAARPVTATTYVVAPVAAPQDFTIQAVPDTAAVRAAIEAELRGLYRREAEPGGTMLITHQREAVSSAQGESDHVVTVPSANQTHTTGMLPTLGVITWV